MSYKSHAIREFTKVNDADKFIQKTIFKLLKEFSKQGHSGSSAPYATYYFKKFAEYNNIEDVKKEFIKDGYKPIEESEDDPNKWIQEGTLKLLEIFHKQKHTKESASKVIKYFTKISKFEPLAPIMCTNDEWNSISESMVGNETYQNNRCSAVFKEGQDGKPHYLDAIVWRSQNSSSYTGSVFNSKKERIKSSQTIKLPFIPKTFYVDVIDYEIAPDDWESHIKDESQLKSVWKYYEHQETPSYLRLKKLKNLNEKLQS